MYSFVKGFGRTSFMPRKISGSDVGRNAEDIYIPQAKYLKTSHEIKLLVMAIIGVL
jgi:hypothetical protein